MSYNDINFNNFCGMVLFLEDQSPMPLGLQTLDQTSLHGINFLS